jgi:hypothetical protein
MSKRPVNPLKEPSWGVTLGVSAVIVILLVIGIKLW